jgi:hypothetical protein
MYIYDVAQVPHHSVERWDQISCATELMLSVGTDYKKMKTAWLAMLVQPGTILFHQNTGLKEAIYVIDVNEFGVTRVVVDVKNTKGIKSVELYREPFEVKFVVVDTLVGWYTMLVDVEPPCKAATNLESTEFVGIVAFPCGTDLEPVPRASARRGYAGLTVTFMKKLMTLWDLKFDGPRPELEADVSYACVQHMFPTSCDEDIKLMVARRFEKRIPRYTRFDTVLDKSNIEAMEEGMDDDLHKEAVDVVEGIAKYKSMKKATKEIIKKITKNISKKKTINDVKDIVLTQAWAKLYLPPAPGCTLEKDMVLHFRWKAHYPRDEPPYSFSCVFTAGGMRASLMGVLAWAWNEHFEATGETCPYNLEAYS